MKIKFFSIIIFLLLVGCQKKVPTIQISTPTKDHSVIFGKILTQEGSPMQNTSVRLAEVFRGENNEGAFALDEAFSPSSLSDEFGYYIFNDLNPGEYVLFIGSINSNYMVVANEDGSAIVYHVLPNEVLEIEPIIVHFQ